MKTLFLILFAALLLSACGPSKGAIGTEIEAANHCEEARDCVLLSACPFGCHKPVNRDDYDRILQMTKDYRKYHSVCDYQCLGVQGVECIDDKCVVLE